MIELPLSVSGFYYGVDCIALVVAIGVVAVGSFIGAPTLGDIVIRGTNATDGTTFILAVRFRLLSLQSSLMYY